VLNDLGAAGYALGEFSDVEKHLTEAVRIWRETDGRRFIAPAIQNLATIYSLKGEFDKAEQLYNETLDILRESEVAGDLQRARAIRGLAEVHFYRAGSDKGQLEQAERLFQEALELAARQAGSESADTLQFLASLSRLYSKQGRQAEARSLMEKALVIKLNDSAPGKGEVSPPAPGDVYLHLGIVFSGAGEYDDAKLFFELAISRLQGSRGTDELNLSLSYSGLAFVYEKQRRLPEAETLYKQALEIQKKYHLEEAPFSVETREGYAELLRKMGR
jgi:tetratricopeptide (TPR) repeat protein